MNKKELNTKNIPDIVNGYPTKHKEGFTSEEIKTLIKDYNLDSDKFYEILGINTCMVIGGQTITYHCDIETTLYCMVENRNRLPGEWD